MHSRDYLQRLQEREYKRIGKQAVDWAAVLRDRPERIAEELGKRQRPTTCVEEALPPRLIESYLRGLQLSQLPTPYENPLTYLLMTMWTAEIETSAEEIFDWKYTHKPLVGTFPLGRVNATAIRVPFTEECIILFQENLFTFVNLCAKAVAAAIPFDDSQEPATFHYDIRAIDERLASGQVGERFTDVLTSYLFEGRPHANGQYVLVRPIRTYSEILIQSAELFALGHEHAHLILGHLREGDSNHKDEPEIIQELPVGWDQELQADVVGVMLSIRAMRRRGYDLTFGYIGADLFCSAMDVVNQALGMFRSTPASAPELSTHPSWQQRRTKLRQELLTGVASAGERTLVVARTIEHIIQELWAKARRSLQESVDRRPLSPIWDREW